MIKPKILDANSLFVKLDEVLAAKQLLQNKICEKGPWTNEQANELCRLVQECFPIQEHKEVCDTYYGSRQDPANPVKPCPFCSGDNHE
jgi:hypothetical protein